MNFDVDKKNLSPECLSQTQDIRNEGILKAWLPFWITNTFLNYQTIVKESAAKNMSILALPRVKNTPAVILGSGPSLDDVAPLLKDWKYPIFASGSNITVPTKWGHQPEYVCVFDAGDSMYPKMHGYDWNGTMMLCHPSISPKILQSWKWEKAYYLMLHFGHAWFDEVMPIAFSDFTRYPNEAPPQIMVGIGNAGCTVNNEIQLAHFLGYDPLFLVGVDFGYPGNKSRATRYDWVNGEWKDVGPDEYADRKMHVADNGVLTTEEQIEYKSALLAVYGLDHPQLIDCSNGIITELPKADFKEVVENGGRGFEHIYRSREEIERVAMDYDDSRKRLQAQRDENRTTGEVLREAERCLQGDTGIVESGGGSVSG